MHLLTPLVTLLAVLFFLGGCAGVQDFEVDETRILPPPTSSLAMLGFSVRLDRTDGTRLIAGAKLLPGGVPIATVYRRTPRQLDWTLEASLSPPQNDGDQSHFGERVDIEGNFAAVASYAAGPAGAGAVYLYTRSASGAWSYATSLSSPLNGSRSFGDDLAMGGGRLLVAAKRRTLSAAASDYFLYSLSDPSVPTVLAPLAPLASVHMGLRAAALTATHAFTAYPAQGSVAPSFLFAYNLQNSALDQVITSPDLNMFSSLAASPNFVAGGAYAFPSVVRVYQRSVSTQSFADFAVISNPDANAAIAFSASLAIDDDRLVIGMDSGSGLREYTGAVYSYTLLASGYAPPIRYGATNGKEYSHYGYSVSIAAGVTAVGVFGAACDAPKCVPILFGAVHVYNQSNSCESNPLALSAVCDVASKTLYYFHSTDITTPTTISVPIVIAGNLTISAPIEFNTTRPITSLGCLSIEDVSLNVTLGSPPPSSSVPVAQAQCFDGRFGQVAVRKRFKDCKSYSAEGQSFDPVSNTLSVTLAADSSGCGGGRGRTAAIVGGVVGGVVLLAIIIGVVIYLGHVRRMFTGLDIMYRSAETMDHPIH